MRKLTRLLMVPFFFMLGYVDDVQAIKANPNPISIRQPDGSVITIRVNGDENFNYVTTVDGYLIRRDKDGFFKYVDTSAGNGYSVLSKQRVSNFNLRGDDELRFISSLVPAARLQEDMLAVPRVRKAPEQILSRRVVSPTLPGKMVKASESQYLVILVNFKDKAFSFENSDFETWLNQEGYSQNGGTGSVKDYYRDNSMGKFIPNFVVLGPYTLEHEQIYYAGNDEEMNQDQNPRAMVVEACNLAKAANPDIDFSQFDNDGDGFMDNVNIIYAGYSEASTGNPDDMWPHSWTMGDQTFQIDGVTINNYACSAELVGANGVKMDGIGTFVHEFGHVLGLKDQYDTDQYTNGYGLDPGAYSLYASGSYNNDSRTPPCLMAFERMQMGWCEPVELKDPEDVTLLSVANNEARYINAQPNREPGTGFEWFVLENRQQVGWDAYIPAHGLLIYHYDYTDEMVEQYWSVNGPNNNAKHRCMYIKVADGIDDTNSRNGDTYPGKSGNTEFTDSSNPNALNWNGEKTNVPITNIVERNGVIYFQVSGGVEKWSVVKTNTPEDIRDTSARFRASLVSATQSVLQMGFCWAVGKEPTIDDSMVYVEVADQAETLVEDLQPGTNYNVRAFMKLEDGTLIYGSSVPFMTECKLMVAPCVGDFTSWTNGVLDCWQIVDRNGDGTTWIYDESTEGMAYQFDYWNNADDWLISSRMLVPENGCLSFVRGVTESTTVEVLDVYVSTKTRDLKDFHRLKRFSFADNFGQQVPEEVDLSAYAGKEIYVAFVCRSEKLQNTLWIWQFYLASKLPAPKIQNFGYQSEQNTASLSVNWSPVDKASKYYLEFAEVTDEVFSNAVFVPEDFFSKVSGNVELTTGNVLFTGDGVIETKNFPDGITNCMFIMTSSGPVGTSELMVEGLVEGTGWEQLGTILKASSYDNEGIEVLLGNYMKGKTYQKLRFTNKFGGRNIRMKYLTFVYNDGFVWNSLAAGSVDGTSMQIDEKTPGEFMKGKLYVARVYSGDGILFYDASEPAYFQAKGTALNDEITVQPEVSYTDGSVSVWGLEAGCRVRCTSVSGMILAEEVATDSQCVLALDGYRGLLLVSIWNGDSLNVVKLMVK